MNAVLAYVACGIAACAIMLELRILRHLTAELKRLEAVFIARNAHQPGYQEADDA